MGSVEVFTKARSLAIENNSIVSGSVVNGRLILTKKNGTTVDAGAVKGDTGAAGTPGVGLTPTDIGTGTLNNLRSNGFYYQASNANATALNGYPTALAGFLEVYSNGGNFVWQHYTTYNGGDYASTLWVRSTDASGVWGSWKCVNPPKLAVTAVCDTALSLTTTQTDLSGTTVTLTSLGTSDLFMVSANIDIQSLGTTATSGVVRLVVDSAARSETANWQNGAISGLRSMIAQQWLVTGLSAGTHTLKLAALRSGGADAMVRVNATTTTLLGVRL